MLQIAHIASKRLKSLVTCSFATLILSKNSRVLDAKSRQRSASQQLKKVYLAKGFLQKLLAMMFSDCLVVRRGSMTVRQGDAWFKTAAEPQGTKILNCRIGTRRVQCRGGLQCTLHFRSRKLAAQFPTFSAPLVLQFCDRRVQKSNPAPIQIANQNRSIYDLNFSSDCG